MNPGDTFNGLLCIQAPANKCRPAGFLPCALGKPLADVDGDENALCTASIPCGSANPVIFVKEADWLAFRLTGAVP